MDKIIMLSGANIRKSKSQAVSLLIFVLTAVLFLNIGLVLYIDFGKFFDKRAEELHAPHVTILQSTDTTTDEQIAWLAQYPEAGETERKAVLSSMGEYYMNGLKSAAVILFANAETTQKMNLPTFIGETLPLEHTGIYVPYLMKTTGGYALGDEYTIFFCGAELHFRTVLSRVFWIDFGGVSRKFSVHAGLRR